MLPVASTRPFRRATLRDLTRLALTALVLAVGLGGVFAPTTGPAAATPTRPAVSAARVAESPATARPTDEQPTARPTDEQPTARSTDEQPTDFPARPIPARRDAASTDRPLAAPAATTDPVRDATGRRGPPRR
ncbi:hypothetical protein AB0F73_30420 [Micromonospora purpureochromogenes]|uniref:hypothetical protein n=1 Tax=Micromonospora purpureochromogenes TaxID=47872 RepID=UPI0033E79186